MRIPNIARLAATLAGAFLLSAQPSAHAEQTVKLLVGYAPGGPVDAAARLFAPVFAKELGAQAIVENRPGGNATIAGSAVVNAAPDGSMLFFAASPTMTISPNVMKKMPFDPGKDLRAVAPILSYGNVLVINKDLPFRSIDELVKFAKANPGKVTYGSAGIGGSNHLSGELFALQTGTQLNHIPYKGNAPAMTDVMGGQLTMMFDIIGSARNYISTDRVRALAVTSAQRNASLPDLPTMREAGLPDFEVIGWFGLFGPAAMPDDMVAKYNDAARRALAQPELRDKLVQMGYDLWVGEPKLLADKVAKEREMWAGVTKNIKFD